MSHHATTAETYLNNYDISSEDIDHLRSYGQLINPMMELYVDEFYLWLKDQDEFDEFFGRDEALVRRVAEAQGVYWREFFTGVVDEDYLAKRRIVGQVHARIGLPLPIYFSAMNMWLVMLVESKVPDGVSADELIPFTRSIMKLVHLDTAIVVEVYAEEVNRKLSLQTDAIMEMSTPVSAI